MNNGNYIKTKKSLRGICYDNYSINDSNNKLFFIDLIIKQYNADEFIQTFPQTLAQDFYSIVWYHKGKGKHVIDGIEYEIKDNTLSHVSSV
mgnify:FL=1